MTDAEKIKMLRQALYTAREALRAPANEWKGECERLALNVINDALATANHIADTGEKAEPVAKDSFSTGGGPTDIIAYHIVT